MRSIPPSSSATRATTATAFATTWRSEASNPSSRRDRTVRRQSNTIGKPTSGETSSSDASIASSNSGASPPDTRKPRELTFRCYASQQRNSGSKPSTRPRQNLTDAKPRFLQIAANYAWINPHLSIDVEWDGAKHSIPALVETWDKWPPSYPTSAHWYDRDRMERRIAAQIAYDQDHDEDTLVREFLVEFRGLSGTAKQKTVLEKIGGARMPLSSFYRRNGFDKAKIAALLAAMQEATNPVQPKQLGIIGKDNFRRRFEAAGGYMASFQYKVIAAENDGRPCLVEAAYAASKAIECRRMVVGDNWSPAISRNPFQAIGKGGDSLDSLLANQRVQHHDKAIFAFHVACPTVQYTDRGKSAMVVGGAGQLVGDEDTFDDSQAMVAR